MKYSYNNNNENNNNDVQINKLNSLLQNISFESQ